MKHEKLSGITLKTRNKILIYQTRKRVHFNVSATMPCMLALAGNMGAQVARQSRRAG